MVFKEVFSTLLSGCGMSLSEVERSRKWRELRGSAENLSRRFGPNTPRGEALRAGPLKFGAQLAGLNPAQETAKAWQYQPEVLAALRFGGEALVRAAQKCLPQSYPCPKGKLFICDKQEFPISLQTMVEQWKSGDPKRQIWLAEMLSMTLVGPKEDHITEAEDRADQPAERILPARFGRFVPNARHRANCLGKGILLAAFGKLVGARMLTAVPLVNAKISNSIHSGRLAKKVQESAAFNGICLADRYADCLREFEDFGSKRETYVDWLHMGIALRISNGNWVLADPNMGLISVLPKDWKLDQVYSTLHSFRSILPGLSITKGEKPCNKHFELCAALTSMNCLSIAPLAKAVREKNPGRDELVRMLSESDFLDVISEWPNFWENEFPPNPSRRLRAICVLLEFLMETGSSKVDKLKFDLDQRCLWFIDAHFKSEEELINQMDDSEARTAFDRLVWKFILHGLQTFKNLEDWGSLGRTLVHPICQFSLLEPGLAIPTLSHIAVAEHETQSDLIEAMLARNSFDHFRLLYSAAAPLRGSVFDEEVSSLSAGILRALPTKLPNAEIILHALDRAPGPLAVEKGQTSDSAIQVCS